MSIKSLIFASIATLLFFPSRALAISEIAVPDFPSCSSPNGTLKVSYSTGTHGIVGNTGSFIGSDAVYIVNDSNLIQCFCAADGSGIQTNWWQAGSLSASQINTLKAEGWIYVPTGLPWGLADVAYFAKNISYPCGTPSSSGSSGFSQPGPGSAPVCNSAKPQAPTLLSVSRNGSSATLTWTKVDLATHYTIAYGTSANQWTYGVPNTGNVTSFTINGLDSNTKYYFQVIAVNDCMPSDPSSDSRTGSVLGASTVLGLAATGNWVEITSLTVFGLVTLSLYFLARKKSGV